MKIPTDREVFEGEIATYWFEDGLLVSLSKSERRTVENLKRNIELVKKITNNNRVPLLIYLANSPMPDKAARKFSTEQVATNYTAMAMISKPGLAKFIMDLLFALKPPPIPMKNFSDEVAAKKWLKEYL